MSNYFAFRKKFFDRVDLSYFGIIGTGIILISFLVTSIMYRGSDRSTYSPLNHFVSELGYVGISEFAWLFNGGLIIGGLFIIVFMWGLGGLINSRLSEIASIIGVISAIFATLVGFFPMNNLGLHAFIALSYFYTGLITILFFSIAIYRDKNKTLPLWFVWFGISIFIAFFIFLFFPFNNPTTTNLELTNIDAIRPSPIWGIALVEWICVLGIILWIMVLSFYLRTSKN